MPRGRRFTSRHLSSQSKASHVERNGVIPKRHKQHYGKKNPPLITTGATSLVMFSMTVMLLMICVIGSKTSWITPVWVMTNPSTNPNRLLCPNSYRYLACVFWAWPVQSSTEVEGVRTAGQVSGCFAIDTESPVGVWVLSPGQGVQSKPTTQSIPFARLTKKCPTFSTPSLTTGLCSQAHWLIPN